MTDENKYNLVAPAPDLFASSEQIEEQINEKVPEDNEEGMRLGTPVDFAEQFNNTLISAAGAPVDMISWAGRKAMTTVGVSEETAGKWFPREAFGSSANIKETLNPLDIGSDRKADTLLGHAGNASAEGVALLTGGAGIIQKTKKLKGVVGGLSRSADDALRTNLGGVVTAEMIAGAGAGIGRGVAEENEFGATGAFLTEFSTGALALMSAAGAKKVVVDPLIAKLNNMTQKEALEKLSKEEIAEVVAEGQRVIAKEEPAPKKTPEPEETLEAPEASATTATPKDTPEATPAPKKDYEIDSVYDEDGEIDYDVDEALRKIAKERDLGITSDREANSVVRNEDGEVIGGTFVSNDGDNYTFDVVVSEAADGTGVGSKLLDDVIEMPYELREINPDATMQVDVVSPKMKEMLERRGFEVKEEIGKDRWLMEPKDYDNVGKSKVVEPTPAPKTPEVTPEETPFKDYKESEAYAEEIGGLGINRSPRVDASLVDLTDEALKTQKRQAEKALDKLESGKMETRKEVDEVVTAQDRLSEFENEEFRRRFKVNIDEYKAAASDEERAEIMDFIKSELFDDIGRSKDEDFKLAFLMDQLSKEGLFNDFMVANKRELQAKIDADPEFQASYEEVFKGDLLDKLNRGKALLEDASSVRLASKTPETPIKPQDAIDGPTISTPALEADPSNADEFVALVDQLLTGDRRRGRGIQGTDKVARVFDQYRERLNTVISGLRSGASTMDEASALLDELAKVAPKKFELDNVDAGSLAIRNPDKDPASFQALMTEEKAEIVADIERLRDVINFQKDVGEDFDNIEALRKRILGDVEEAPVVKAEEPKPTSKGTEEAAPKPTASQERIKKLEKETNLLHALVSGEDISQIDGVAGMHPSLKPKGNKTDTKTYEQFLKKRKAELKKAARELQKAEINVIKDRILNPAIYKRSRIDKALDVNFHARTAFGLSAPYSMTAGVVSAGINIALTPIRDMLGSTLWKGLTLKDKSIVRKALYASSDMAAYYDTFMTIFSKNTYRDTGAALLNRGKNPNFADGDVRFKEGYSADGEGNVRELAKQRKQLKRVEAQEGIKNTFSRIKLMDSAASVAMELINLPYTVIGAVDTPFTSAMIMGKLRAEGLRAGIDQEVPDLAKFVDDYVENAFKEQNGRKVWAYKQEYEHIRQQADDGLFKNRKLDKDDIRKTATESMLDLITKHTTQGTIGGRIVQSLMWVVSTPSIAVTKGTKFALSPMLTPLRYVGKGAATLSPNSEFNTSANKIMARDRASFKTLRKEISALKARKEEAIGAKEKAVIEKELIQKNDSLKSVETRLEKNKVRMAEMDSEAIGNALLATGMYIMFWDMSEKNMITGGGHWMNDDQKRSSNFQPYMLLRDNGTGGHDYRMAEPYRIVTSIIADVQTWHEYKEKGLLTEDQLDLTAMIARTIRGILQDSPFTGGVKNVMRLFSPTSAQDTRAEVGTEMLFGMVPTIPNAFKAPKREDQRYFDDRTQTRDLGDRLWQNLAASPAPNLKRDEYGRPKQRNKKNLASAVLRTAKQKFPMSTLREYELDQIIEADNRLGNIIGAVTTSYKTHDTKEYWRNGETTMYEDFQVFLQTFENSNGMTMIDEALEIIQEDDWDELYNNGRLGSLNVLEEIEDIDEAYDQYGGLKGGMSKDSNLGLEKLRDARNKTIKEAQAEFFQQERMEQYLNKDGENPAQALMNQQQFEKNFGWMPQN